MRLDWKAVVGIAITVFLLWFIFQDVDFVEVWARVRQGNMALLLGAVVVATFGFLIRAMRWKFLLAPLDPDTSLHSRFAAVSIGFMANNVLPARIGEFARAYAFSRIEPISVSAVFGTLVVERVLDGLTLLAILLFAVSWPTFPGAGVMDDSRVGTAVDVVTIGTLAMVVGMVVLLLKPRPFVRLAERVAVWLPGDFARPIVNALEAFLDSLVILRRPILLGQAIVWSVGFWVFHGASFWMAMLAFGIQPVDSFVAALFTEAVVGFGVAVPSAPGFFGTFHWAADWALSEVYGVEPARALAFAFGYHLGGWLPITLIGFWYAWRLGLSMGDVKRSEERVEEAVEAQHPVAAQLLAVEGRGDPPPSVQNPRPVAAAVVILAPAKVNLALRVFDRDEATGFHEIETVFQAVDLADRLRIQVAPAGVSLDVRGIDVGPERDNLVWRAAAAFAAETGLVRGLRIELEKRIPPGAGLGGGSSDAAATLRALNALFGEPVPRPRLAELAELLGSDVPFFLGASPLAVGRGRGEELEPATPLPEAWMLIVVPDVHVDTAEAYAALDRWREEGTGRPARSGSLTAPESWEEAAARAANDFEEVVVTSHEEIRTAREGLEAHGPLSVLLTGSGSAVFALYEDRERAEAARAHLAERAEGTGPRLVSTLSRWPEPELEDPGRA